MSSLPPPSDPPIAVEVVQAPAPDKSRFRFQKLLQPFTLHRGIATPVTWFFLDWLVFGAAIATLWWSSRGGSESSPPWWQPSGSHGCS